jgi:hypothetical protein
MARRWFDGFVKEGGGFKDSDFRKAWQGLHATRDQKSGHWKMGANIVVDPRMALSMRLEREREYRERKHERRESRTEGASVSGQPGEAVTRRLEERRSSECGAEQAESVMRRILGRVAGGGGGDGGTDVGATPGK